MFFVHNKELCDCLYLLNINTYKYMKINHKNFIFYFFKNFCSLRKPM